MPNSAGPYPPHEAIVRQFDEEIAKKQGVEQTAAVDALLGALLKMDNTLFAGALYIWLERAAWASRANPGTRVLIGRTRIELGEQYRAAIAVEKSCAASDRQSDHPAEITAADGVQIAVREQPVNGARAAADHSPDKVGSR